MAKEFTTKRTTQALLQRLQYCVDNYTPEIWRTTTKERLQWQYEIAKQVSETLRLNEIMLLYYLRNSQYSYTYSFVKVAKKLYEANQEFKKIKKGKREE